MSSGEQTKAFADDLDKLVDRYRSEFDLTYAIVTGTLQMKVWLLNEEASNRDDEV